MFAPCPEYKTGAKCLCKGATISTSWLAAHGAIPEPYGWRLLLRARRACREERMRNFIACGVLAVLVAVTPAQAQSIDKVRLGWLKSLTDTALYVAIKKGYFSAEKIEIVPTQFRSGANMVVPLGSGELDVGAGSPSAGLYNAVARGVKMVIAADKTRSSPGYGGAHFIVRKVVVDSGRFKDMKDLKGLRIALSGPGNSNTASLYYAIRPTGVKYGELTITTLGYPAQVTAMANNAIDVSIILEPFASAMAAKGVAVRVRSDDEVDPEHQLACLLFSGQFAAKRDLAVRFLRAYLRGVQFYRGALKDGKLAGPNAEEVISLIIANTVVKDPKVLRSITLFGVDPNGAVNAASLQKDLDFYATQGWIKGKVDLGKIVDQSFVQEAARTLNRAQ
jgi:NitT/TauT family transport system substrate-binding protein